VRWTGGSGAVNAVLTLFGVSELGVPLALGFVADHVSLFAALALLSLQPIGLTLLALLGRPQDFVDPRGDPP
jgi:hypothetical protein